MKKAITPTALKIVLQTDTTAAGVARRFDMSEMTLRKRFKENPALQELWDTRYAGMAGKMPIRSQDLEAIPPKDIPENHIPEKDTVTEKEAVELLVEKVLAKSEPLPEVETETWVKGDSESDPIGLYKDITVRVSQRQMRCLQTIAEWKDKDIQEIYSEAFDNLIDYEFSDKVSENWSEHLDAVKQVLDESKYAGGHSFSLKKADLLKHILIFIRDASSTARIDDLKMNIARSFITGAITQLERP